MGGEHRCDKTRLLPKEWAHRPEPLTIVGEGPNSERLRTLAGPTPRFTDALPRDEVPRRMAGARAVLLPPLWFEGFPIVVAEAFFTGTPVVASRIVGSGDGLAERFARLRQGAATTWETSLSPAASLRALNTIHARAIASRAAAQPPRMER